jgi:hypothetical protein
MDRLANPIVTAIIHTNIGSTSIVTPRPANRRRRAIAMVIVPRRSGTRGISAGGAAGSSAG